MSSVPIIKGLLLKVMLTLNMSWMIPTGRMGSTEWKALKRKRTTVMTMAALTLTVRSNTHL